MSASLDDLTPDTRVAVERWLEGVKALGYEVKITSTRRTCAEQNGLFAIGRGEGDSRAKVTYARGCVSWHVLGRAIDFLIQSPSKTEADYRKLGELGKSLGFKWGGDFPGFPDLVHLEWHGTVPIEDVCPNPDDCTGAVQRSMALNIPVGGGGSAGGLLALTVGIVAGVYLADRYL